MDKLEYGFEKDDIQRTISRIDIKNITVEKYNLDTMDKLIMED